MAIVSIKWGESAQKDLKYVQKERADQDVTSSSGCSIENASEDFESVRREHHKESGNQCLHIVQSFHPKESNSLTPEQFNELGTKLAEEHFKDHQFLVRTHTDKGHIHNHIVVNTVNAETGKKIENKRSLLTSLRASSDKLCLENGLSVINPDAHERRLRLPYKVQQMVRAGKKSYILDLAQKADVARSIATSFDEYRETLSGFGIRTVIEEKNISYFYPGKEKGKRGANLGKDYDKPGLIQAFKDNDIKFAKSPGLKATLLGQSEQIKTYGMPKTPAGVSPFLNLWDGGQSAWKDYTQYTHVPRRSSERTSRSDQELKSSFVPVAEIQKAKSKSIFEYCDRNKIVLTTNTRGDRVIKGREFVTVSKFEFKNGKNGTKGTLVDLVAAHKNLTLLQAVAHINGNDRLLLLEQQMGAVKHSYRSFYVPKAQRADLHTATLKIGKFLSSLGADPKMASTLSERGLAHVSKTGSVWFFSKESGASALEFVETATNAWTKKTHGKSRIPFCAVPGTSSRALVFGDPESLFQKVGVDLFSEKRRKVGIIGLLESEEHGVDHFVAEHQHVRVIQFVPSKPGHPSHVELDLFNNLKRKYETLGISVELVPHERALHRTLEGRERDVGLSL